MYHDIIPSAVTQFISGGDLHQLWEKTGSFEEELVKVYVGEMAIVLGKLKITI